LLLGCAFAQLRSARARRVVVRWVAAMVLLPAPVPVPDEASVELGVEPAAGAAVVAPLPVEPAVGGVVEGVVEGAVEGAVVAPPCAVAPPAGVPVCPIGVAWVLCWVDVLGWAPCAMAAAVAATATPAIRARRRMDMV